MTHPLWRNRDFLLLQTGQFLSMTGHALTTVAYPLLVLALDGSAAAAGLVAFARLAPYGLFSIVAGVAADAWSRRRLMIAADAVGALALGTLSTLIVLDEVAVWHIVVVAVVEGFAGTFFGAGWNGAFRAIVPTAQLPAAFAANEARRATQRLFGPPLGGALYGINRSIPFIADAVSYAGSTLTLLLTRTPFQETRERDTAPLRTRIAEGFAFLWRQPFLRTTAFLYGIGNFLAPAVTLAVVVIAEQQGLSAAEIGFLITTLGVGTLVGALVSPLLRKALSVRTILLCELWTWLASWLFVLWPNAYVLAGALALFGVAAPVTDSVVMALGLALTPDRLVGRVSSVRLSIAILIAPLGPLAAGLLLASVSPRATIAALAVVGLVLAVWGTFSPAIRDAPPLVDVEGTSHLPPKSRGVKSEGSPKPGGLLGDSEGPTPNS